MLSGNVSLKRPAWSAEPDSEQFQAGLKILKTSQVATPEQKQAGSFCRFCGGSCVLAIQESVETWL